ncbi:MAG: diaminopimelate epimerase [Cyclobacteriaceae bacterium]
MGIRFYKYQGTGNDFIMIDDRSEVFETANLALIQNLCDRKFGVGADGLILIRNKYGYDFEMCYFNADGSQSMCGNGARCAVAFSSFLGIISSHTGFFAIDGPHKAKITGDWVELEMSPVKEVIKVEKDFYVDTGSPHHVKFVEDLNDYEVVEEGRSIRNQKSRYPNGTNVNFVKSLAKDHIQVRTYERGVEDETLSCGTGVTACALVQGLIQNIESVKISSLGGSLEVRFQKDETGGFHHIILAGPTKQVYAGNIGVDSLETNPMKLSV